MKRAFTIIELIVAMAIMLILAALVAKGVGSMLEGQREAATRQTLQGVNSLLSERVRTVGNNLYPDQWYYNGVYGPHSKSAPGLWIAIERHDDASGAIVYSPMTLVDTSIPEDYSTWQSDLLRNTVIIFNDLHKSPHARKSLANMKTVKVQVPINGVAMEADIPVDGWGRPVLFSPAVGVTVDGTTVYQQSTSIQYTTAYAPSGVFPFAFSAGKNGNPSDVVNVVR